MKRYTKEKNMEPYTMTPEMVVARTPNGREIRLLGDKYLVQPHNDNYWIACDSVDEAMFQFWRPHEDYAPTDGTATELAQRIVDSWDSEWSIHETARIGLSDADLDACNELAEGDEALAVAISLEVERVCREWRAG